MPSQAPYAAHRIFDEAFPTTAGRTLRFNLKDVLDDEILANAYIRVVGDVDVSGGSADGVASGNENPEGLIRGITARMKPDLGMSAMRDLTARGQINAAIFHGRGFAIRETDVPGSVATTAIDFYLPLLLKKPASINPIEWGIPMEALDEYILNVTVGDETDLFDAANDRDWDFSGLVVEIWVVTRKGFPGAKFHAAEQFEEIIPITVNRDGLKHILERGFIYSDMLICSERDNAAVDDIVDKVRMISGGREWFPGDVDNVSFLKRLAREEMLTTAAESLVGLIPLPNAHDGRITQMPDGGAQRIELLLDVTFGAGAQNVIIRGTRVKPFRLNNSGASPAAKAFQNASRKSRFLR